MKNTKTLDESSLVSMFTSPNLANWKNKLASTQFHFFLSTTDKHCVVRTI